MIQAIKALNENSLNNNSRKNALNKDYSKINDSSFSLEQHKNVSFGGFNPSKIRNDLACESTIQMGQKFNKITEGANQLIRNVYKKLKQEELPKIKKTIIAASGPDQNDTAALEEAAKLLNNVKLPQASKNALSKVVNGLDVIPKTGALTPDSLKELKSAVKAAKEALAKAQTALVSSKGHLVDLNPDHLSTIIGDFSEDLINGAKRIGHSLDPDDTGNLLVKGSEHANDFFEDMKENIADAVNLAKEAIKNLLGIG